LIEYQHIFYRHLLPKQHQLPELKQSFELIWPSIFLIFCFLLLVFLKVTSFSKVIKVIQSCFSLQSLRQLEREKFNPFKFYSVLLSVFFLLNFTFFVYKINYWYKLVLVEYPPFAQFMFFLLIIVFLFVFRNGFSKLLSIFINDHKVIPEFIYSSFIVSQTLGLLIFPCMVLVELSTFNPLIFLSAASVILIAMQGFKWYKGLTYALVDNRVGLLQIFTYFCSLEILPVLVLVKFIIETF
jgi:hypothetical protein